MMPREAAADEPEGTGEVVVVVVLLLRLLLLVDVATAGEDRLHVLAQERGPQPRTLQQERSHLSFVRSFVRS